MLSSRGGAIEIARAAAGRSRCAYRPAIDAGRLHGGKEKTIESRIACVDGAVATVGVEVLEVHATLYAGACINPSRFRTSLDLTNVHLASSGAARCAIIVNRYTQEKQLNIPRLNGIIKVLEQGKHAFVSFSPADTVSAQSYASEPYDGTSFEMEHGAFDTRTLRDCCSTCSIAARSSNPQVLRRPVTPLVRIPPNGIEMNQWIAKQVLDTGVYGIVWPHVSTVAEAHNAVAACRYARPAGAPRYEPKGQRGDGPTTPRVTGASPQQEYYERADVWPLDPER